MKKTSLLITAVLTALNLSLQAADTKKLEGEATCAKCTLKQADACQTAIIVTGADGKKETYLAAKNDVAKAFHKNICTDTKKVKAEGTVTEKDGKKEIELTKIDLAE
jgi:Family of unknown function (DUF6370)